MEVNLAKDQNASEPSDLAEGTTSPNRAIQNNDDQEQDSQTTIPSASAPASAPAAPLTLFKSSLILGVAVVDFNHLQGPIVEWSYPKSLSDSNLHPDLTSSLPFCALPDGSHLSDEDFAHFHLHCPTISKHSTVFGISCNRQIASEKLLVKSKDVTRSTVQKAVVVLARQPVFAPLREKLGIVTRAFFAQGDLADTDILVDFYDTLEAGLRAAGLKGEDVAEDDDFAEEEEDEDIGDQTVVIRETEDQGEDNAANGVKPSPIEKQPIPPPSRDEQSKSDELREGVMYMGTSLRELIFKFRFKTLILVKLLLLQKRIMFFGYPVEKLCVFEYTLVSLIPGLLLSLSDCSSPELSYTSRHKLKLAEDVKTSNRHSLLRFVGCPLRIFGQDSFFQPYLPLQQIELLKAKSWLVGTTNLIFKQQKEFRPDVIVDLETSTLEYPAVQNLPTSSGTPRASTSSNSSATIPGELPSQSASSNPTSHQQHQPTLQSIVALTPADRKWMDELVQVVVESYNPNDPSRPTTLKYEGSEDWIRAKFEDYICAMLSCVKYSDSIQPIKSDPSQTNHVTSSSSDNNYPPSRSSTPFGTKDPHISQSGLTESNEIISSYNALFIHAFKSTKAYEIWNSITSSILFDLVPYQHPCGNFKISTLEDVSLRLSNGFYDLKIDQQLNQSREAFNLASKSVWNFANKASESVAKRRREWIAQQQQQQQQQPSSEVTPADVNATMADGTSSTINSNESSAPMNFSANLPANMAPHAQAAQQAAMQAGTEVRAAFGRFSTYLGGRGWGGGGASASGTPPPSAK
ncbi:unnamed protein product [Sympodiomycopsis kandeliae]